MGVPIAPGGMKACVLPYAVPRSAVPTPPPPWGRSLRITAHHPSSSADAGLP